ncbi:ribosomal-processing cysteine protease Prp [Blautia producta]|nr:ribosomal-processing cysteine protease Prp [Blautia producta]
MTYITFYQDSDGVVTGFDTSRHAGYAKQGEDIICAAISALVINAVNSIEEFTEDAF